MVQVLIRPRLRIDEMGQTSGRGDAHDFTTLKRAADQTNGGGSNGELFSQAAEQFIGGPTLFRSGGHIHLQDIAENPAPGETPGAGADFERKYQIGTVPTIEIFHTHRPSKLGQSSDPHPKYKIKGSVMLEPADRFLYHPSYRMCKPFL
jgi:hypothetical protein